MDHERRRQRRQPQCSPRCTAPGSGGGASSGKKHKAGGGGGGGGGGRKAIEVVYISNPMRVKTSAAGFRALVQELTGRHADPSKYSPEAEVLSPSPSPAAVDHQLPDDEEDPDDDDGFCSQLLDNSYAVFSPPTLLYDDRQATPQQGFNV